jgi:hypothetical protein
MKSYLATAILVSAVTLVAAPCTSAQSIGTVDVVGKVFNRSGKVVGSFEGQLEIVRFQLNNAGDIVATGNLSGDLLSRGGDLISSITNVVISVPLVLIDAIETDVACEVLSLTLGPIDLNVLGLIVHLDRVVLDVSADPTGGLLGSLLCALAGLDLGGLLGGVLNILDLILSLLGIGELEGLIVLGALLDFLNSITIL